MNKIQDIKKFKGTHVLFRADFNVPIQAGKIIDTFRIDATIKTISYIVKKGGLLTIVAHLGDDGTKTLHPVYDYLRKAGLDISFFDGPITKDTVTLIKNERKTKIVLVENIRQNKGEKINDKAFARVLASLADVYVNDAFSVCHREHASVVGVPKHIPGYAGFQLQDEVNHLSKAFSAKHPFVFILGGNKFSTKLPSLKKFIPEADTICLGGALLNDVLLSVGFPVGKSLVEEDKTNVPMLKKLYINKKFIAPTDVVVERDGIALNVGVNEVKPQDLIYDLGEETERELIEKMKAAKFILWNGPLGKYTSGYDKASKRLLKVLASYNKKKTVIIGGGDTVSLITKMKLLDAFTFVSTGGGATLDFLTKETLPGIKVLK